jgi:hypothetical protein
MISKFERYSFEIDREKYSINDTVYYTKDGNLERKCKIGSIEKGLLILKENEINLPINLNLVKENKMISKEERYNIKDRKKLLEDIKDLNIIIQGFEIDEEKIKDNPEIEINPDEDVFIKQKKEIIYNTFSIIGFSIDTGFSNDLSNDEIKEKIKEIRKATFAIKNIIDKKLKLIEN